MEKQTAIRSPQAIGVRNVAEKLFSIALKAALILEPGV
jgi:hypothetical protein